MYLICAVMESFGGIRHRGNDEMENEKVYLHSLTIYYNFFFLPSCYHMKRLSSFIKWTGSSKKYE